MWWWLLLGSEVTVTNLIWNVLQGGILVKVDLPDDLVSRTRNCVQDVVVTRTAKNVTVMFLVTREAALGAYT